jgi:hypothetical protein
MTKKRSAAPPKLGVVFTAKARIQRIDSDTMKWVTLATCSDTPNAIKAAAAKLNVPMTQLWVVGDVTERKMICDL